MAEKAKDEVKTVKFKTSVSWAGHNFSYAPGDIVELPEDVAHARAKGGAGTIVDSSAKS
jgi:hypothetical protein